MTVIPLRNILINGVHCAALTEVEVDEATGKALIARRMAAVPKQAGVSRARAIEAAKGGPVVAEVATGAALAPPKSSRRKAAP